MSDNASPNSQTLAGRTALVTGSTRQGIGATTAMALAFHGANVILSFGTGSGDAAAQQRADALAKRLDGLGGKVAVIEASIQSEAEVKELFSQATCQFGGVDILVNNAGGTWLEQDFAGIETRHWDQAVRSEIDGTFYCIREALPHMRDQHWGRIVNVCHDDATLTMLINAHYGHVLEKYPYDFAVAKFAKREMGRLLALSELKHGITINNVLPGIIEELSVDEALATFDEPGAPRLFFSPVDVTQAIVFLCSDEARGVTQSDLRIPGNIYIYHRL